MAGERPKRPLSAYMLWLNEHREQLKKENPGSKVTEIAKRGGELWRAIKDKTVRRYNYNFKMLQYLNEIFLYFFLQEWEQKAIKMKEEYNKAVKEYEANGGTDTGAGKKRKSKGAKPAKKAKKKETSEEEEEEESE